MADLTFEPYSTIIKWSAPAGFEGWQEALTEFMHLLAQKCTRIGTVIGHIKALALFDGQGFIQLSAVDRNHPVTVLGLMPAGIEQLDLSINILVFGISHEQLAQAATQAAAEVSAKWQIRAEFQSEPENHPPHPAGGYN